MIIRSSSTRKGLACFFLVLLITQGLMPTVVWALTSGPAQPETKQFAQAGTSDMVDLSTGDFKYNIPLLDVDGYPVNLNYQSGVGMDDEASWVGLGWNLNAGAMNRQLRGIADDSYGDTVMTENYMKPKLTYGGRVTVRGEAFGNGLLKGSISLGISSDNYTGIGADFGVNAGLSLSGANAGPLTPGIGIGLNSSTSDGVTVTPNVSLSLKQKQNANQATSIGLSASLGYNTREGLKALNLGSSYSLTRKNDKGQGSASHEIIGGSVSYNTPPFYPGTQMPFKSSNFTASLDYGPAAVGLFAGVGVTGYGTKREISRDTMYNRTYGFMYAEKGKGVKDAMVDFMREKDNPIIPELKNLALPIATPDVFSYSSQAGGGQLKLFRNGTGVFFDNETHDISDNKSVSAEFGAGTYMHGGVSIYNQDIDNVNGKWRTDNDFLVKGDYADKSSLIEEDAYFKQVGEKNVEDDDFVTKVLGEKAVNIPIDNKTAQGSLKTAEGVIPVAPLAYKKTGRQVKRSPVMVLTAAEAKVAALDKKIKNYPFNTVGSFLPVACNKVAITTESRDTLQRKGRHISEMSITGDDGKRMVYGLPVYNLKQEEYSFAVDGSKADKTTNLIPFKVINGKIDHKPLINGKYSTDEYYHKESQPAYATSYLLTGILSPDYVDVTGDGITEDDRGTAIKFNYSKVEKAFKWRTPSGQLLAQWNRGLNADPDDDKGSIVYGEKELWYLNSIESRTKIAYFITEDRTDGLGFDWQGNLLKGTNDTRQKRLKEIRLYSKNDLTKPIKTVVLDYDYDKVCPGVPNNETGQGKLTLKSVYFKYASSSKGQYNPYTFEYNPGEGNASQPYALLSSDRWGTFKPVGDNAADGYGNFKNDEFPYTTRNSGRAATNASMWQLEKITLPTGGVIHVNYESDDYAYVQNRRAMQMIKFDDMLLANGESAPNLKAAKKFKFTIPGMKGPSNGFDELNWFKKNCLNGESYMYARIYVNVTDEPSSTSEDKYDFVPVYGLVKDVDINGSVAIVTFEEDNEGGEHANALISAAWQRMRMDYPRYAFPGYKNKINDERPIAAAVGALANSIKNISELWENFDSRANRKNFAANINLSKSFARVVKLDSAKLGGGVRVKKIRMSDEWSSMATDQSTASYGQEYEYETTQDGEIISSGVAAYEPSLGGDENPMRLPVNYVQDVKWGLNNYFYLEEPMGESLFPAPEVVYREVKVRNLDASGNADPNSKTGWNTYEFYTAKEFPVIINQTPLDKNLHKPMSWSSFFGGKSEYELSMSQGYAIFLNDMHGKPKAERVFNQTGEEISSSEYLYNTTEEGGIQRIRNVVDVVDTKGNITKDQVIGREIEMFADMRQSEMNNRGKSINIGIDVLPFGPYALPIPHFPWGKNEDHRLFRSASVVKTIQYYGVIASVIKKINGSSVTAANLLYDKLTGEPVLTQSNNEFDDPVYSINIPAYWIYTQMGPAYQNLGLLMKDFQISQGVIPATYINSLSPGDELIGLGDRQRLWVVNSPTGANAVNAMHIIDASGRVISEYLGNVKVCRSGYRNLLTPGATAITSMKNPVEGNTLKVLSMNELAALNVLSASAIEYHEAWGPAADCNLKSCPEGYQEDAEGRCYWPATRENHAVFAIVDGDKDPSYSSGGAYFFTEFQNDVSNDQSALPFWKPDGTSLGRLSAAGVWMAGANNNGDWWGFEKCFNITETGLYYIGFGADNYMSIYIDNVLFYELNNSGNTSYYVNWRVRAKTLEKGLHTIRMNAMSTNAASKRAAAVEVYGSDYNTLKAGSETIILDKMIFTTAGLKDDANVLTYRAADHLGTPTSVSLTCPEGKTLGLCDGTPNCGFKDKGSCPEGYKPGPDGLSCVLIASTDETDASSALNFVEGSQSQFYTTNGTRFFDVDGTQESIINQQGSYWGMCRGDVFPSFARAAAVAETDSTDFTTMSLSVAVSNPAPPKCGVLNAIGVWLSGGFMNQWIGVHTCLTVPETKLYYIGLGFDNIGRIYIDGTLWNPPVTIPPDLTYTLWPIQLTAGNHMLTIEAMNYETERGFAVEVYNDSLSTLKQGIAHPIYTTKNLRKSNSYYTYVKDTSGNIIRQSYACAAGTFDVCGSGTCGAIANSVALNPYLRGYLGNWLPWKQMVWLSDRSGQGLPYNTLANPTTPDIRHNGQYSTFHAYWVYNNGWGITTNTDWVVSNTISLYDKFSQEQESKDALDRYSSARYGYKSTLPVAVGANMRQREIFYDGFEDYKFNNLCVDSIPCEPDAFNIFKTLGTTYASRLNAADAHSGNYSLNLSQDVTLITYAFYHEHAPGIYLTNNLKGEYYRKADSWLGLRGFCPFPWQRYVFSAWVKDNSPSSPTAGITLTINGEDVTLIKKAAVEGWRLVEGIMTIPAPIDMAEVKVVLHGGAGVFIDDIRIFPYDGQLKTFSYDDKTLRLMAEMDENNYATFYEYDDEGSLVRVKKETERGIMTIKENRSAYHKK